MFVLLAALCILIAVLLILVVVIQNSKGGGLSSTFGASNASNQFLGARRSNEAIEKITWYLAAALAIGSFGANAVLPNRADQTENLRMMQNIENQIIQAPTAIPELTQPAASPDDAAAPATEGN